MAVFFKWKCHPMTLPLQTYCWLCIAPKIMVRDPSEAFESLLVHGAVCTVDHILPSPLNCDLLQHSTRLSSFLPLTVPWWFFMSAIVLVPPAIWSAHLHVMVHITTPGMASSDSCTRQCWISAENWGWHCGAEGWCGDRPSILGFILGLKSVLK